MPSLPVGPEKTLRKTRLLLARNLRHLMRENRDPLAVLHAENTYKVRFEKEEALWNQVLGASQIQEAGFGQLGDVGVLAEWVDGRCWPTRPS